MRRRAAAVASVVVTLFAVAGCCSSKPTIAEFRALPLEAKVSAVRAAYRAGCLREVENVYLGVISNHGLAAADAMAAVIDSPPADFPLRSAVLVASFINANRVELRHHRLYDQLQHLAETSNDDEVKRLARRTVLEIETKQIVK